MDKNTEMSQMVFLPYLQATFSGTKRQLVNTSKVNFWKELLQKIILEIYLFSIIWQL